MIHVYASGWFALNEPAVFDLDLGTADTARSDVVRPGSNIIEVEPNQIRVVTSSRNLTPIYLGRDQASTQFVVGTDLPTVAAALTTITGNSPELSDEIGIMLSSSSSVRGIERIEHCTEILFRKSGSDWKITRNRLADPLKKHPVEFVDSLTSGTAQISALRTVIDECVLGKQDVGVLVSGGVDSGLVAALLAVTGVPCTAYTLGTPWGDEFSEAFEMTTSIGLSLCRISLSADEIVAALPATVRAFGHGDPETVAIGVAITAFCQVANNKPLLLLTGYGSDLINSGMSTEADIQGDIETNVLRAVHRTRYSSEFTATAARANGYRLVHPYWDNRVLEVALRTNAAVKCAFGREKGHLRLAAERFLPSAVAWRKKIAIHHGNGLAANLEALIDSHTGVNSSAGQVYRAMLIEQIRSAVTNPHAALPGHEVYERAVAVVGYTHKSHKKL
ncbi:MAG: asparagine synthase-related protein [Gloeotrichia echinulata DEX184]|nr:asparagine synthase C-terminal domain-containing protein [Gloeotrichia echinulata DEX184]